MSLEDWRKHGWLRPHQTDATEIAKLLEVVERDLRVSGDVKMDPDWRFVAAYNAALQVAAAALYASGYEASKGGGAHQHTIESLRITIAADVNLVDELQAFKAKRGNAVYEMTGIASETEITELRQLGIELRSILIDWLKQKHSNLLSSLKKKK